jgi:1-acyl-sn-glycerol-3-phosphate acyltransferase
MRGSYRADHRGWLFNFLWPFTRYAFTNLSVIVLGIPLFFIFNRTRIIGRKRVPQQRNTLLLSNHQSMIDSFLVGICAYFPQSLVKPYLVPWNPAAEENFFHPWWLGLLSDLWKCIPIRPGRRDPRALYRMTRALESGVMTLFPEGSGLVILANKPAVVPVTIDGMDQVLPIGAKLPRLFKRLYVYYGEPIDYVDRIMDALRRQQAEIQKLKGE